MDAIDLNQHERHGKAASVLVQAGEVSKEQPRTITASVEGTKALHSTDPNNALVASLRWLSRGEEWLDKKMGIETQGIDRIPDEGKRPPGLWNCFWLWLSLVGHVGVIPIGFLGPEFGLSLRQSVSAIMVGCAIGSLCPAYCATLGPKTGLRAVAISRYSFGFWGAKLCSVLNIIDIGGFLVINLVVAGQLMSAVSDYKMTISVGCIIIAVVSYVVSVFGFALIHTYEKYAWIFSATLLSVLLGQAAPHINVSAPGQLTGLGFAGAWLSFTAINIAGSALWCFVAGDYYCNYPASIKSWKVFGLTYSGLLISSAFAITIGACVGNAALGRTYAPFTEAFENHGLGGLIGAIYHPSGWSKVCLVLLSFSLMANNIAIIYSSGLCLQLLGDYFHAVPRLIWSLLVVVVTTIMSVAGKDSLSTIVSNFISLLGYTAGIFTIVLLIENEWFRKGRPEHGYNLEAWDDPQRLPPGIAAVVTLVAAYLVGGMTGMTQVWYIGPISAKFGPYGGDVAFYISCAIAAVCYPPLRYLERKRFGR